MPATYEPVDAYWCRYHAAVHVGRPNAWSTAHLADIDRLDHPMPARGALGLWTPTPDVLAALAA